MEITRVYLRGWTASFRYPTFVSGFQPSLPVPPLSTIYGLLSAARGKPVTPEHTSVGYVFSSKGKTVDIETTYELSGNLKAKSNICRREILFDPELYLYIECQEFGECFRIPHFPLLIGRSTELAMVAEVKTMQLQKRSPVRLGKTLIPFPCDGVYGILQALPVYFTQQIPRKAVGVRPFYLLSDFIDYDGRILWYDEEKKWAVWMHK